MACSASTESMNLDPPDHNQVACNTIGFLAQRSQRRGTQSQANGSHGGMLSGIYVLRIEFEISSQIQGMSPAMANELCTKAGLNASTKLTSVTEEEWQQVHAAWIGWVRVLQSGNFTPTAAPPPDCSVSVIGGRENGTSGSALQLTDDYYRMPEVRSNPPAAHLKSSLSSLEALLPGGLS